jgi:hypothetical protein
MLKCDVDDRSVYRPTVTCSFCLFLFLANGGGAGTSPMLCAWRMRVWGLWLVLRLGFKVGV